MIPLNFIHFCCTFTELSSQSSIGQRASSSSRYPNLPIPRIEGLKVPPGGEEIRVDGSFRGEYRNDIQLTRDCEYNGEPFIILQLYIRRSDGMYNLWPEKLHPDDWLTQISYFAHNNNVSTLIKSRALFFYGVIFCESCF